MSFVTDVYSATNLFLTCEKFGLCNQLQRAAVSIASNIAEGSSRSSEKEFAHFLQISLGSTFEVETQLIIAYNLKYILKEKLDILLQNLQSIEKRLHEMIKRLTH